VFAKRFVVVVNTAGGISVPCFPAYVDFVRLRSCREPQEIFERIEHWMPGAILCSHELMKQV
jgi:hypothetical protein